MLVFLAFRQFTKCDFWDFLEKWLFRDFPQNTNFFQKIMKSLEIIQNRWKNIPEKAQTPYFHKQIDLWSYDT